MKILFLCVANSARSQMAEGLARKIFGAAVEIQSAGSDPSGKVHPLAIQVMKEMGIDISVHRSKSWEELPPQFFIGLNYVITLCAEEICPVIAVKAEKLNWGMPDPAAGDLERDRLEAFRKTRDAIHTRLLEFRRSQ
ncbi:arsenate reductase ArsC [bacterium]|nr:arsenate reductase ArsC [bacterium]